MRQLIGSPAITTSTTPQFHCGVVPPGVDVDPFIRGASCMHAAANRTSSRCTARRPLSLFILLLVGVESNPGPVRHLTAVKNVTIATLNARSAVLHTADLHLIIHDEALDIVS